MSGMCIEVRPISRDRLMELTESLRAYLRIDGPFFPILEVVEFAFPRIWPEFEFTIGDRAEMGNDHGLTFTDRKEIRLREDVYEGVREGKGRDRLTLAHEVGHLLLHGDPAYARVMRDSADIPAYRSSEWQANAFAGSLLMPLGFLRVAASLQQVVTTCGVTYEAAETQSRLLANAGLLNNVALR